MWNVLSVWVGMAVLLAAANSATAETRVVSTYRAGVKNYHQVYGDIINTTITIDDFYVRTNDGKVIKIDTAPMTIDFQDLAGPNKGLILDARKAKFPQNQSEIDVVEIETRISSQRTPFLNFRDGSRCNLTTPRLLNFYTSSPIRISKNEYLVKLDFHTLNAIQLDVILQGQQQVEECDCFGKIFGGGQSCSSRGVGRVRYHQTRKCELVNRRHAIIEISRT